MASTAADTYVSQASQYAKEVYHPNIVTVYPSANWLTKNVKFNSANKVGKQYVVPIELAPEQGVTYLPPNAGKSALNGSVPLATQDATLQPSQIILEREVEYEALKRAAEAGKAAFISMFDATAKSVVNLATKRQEISMLHGQSATGIGTVLSVAVAASGTTQGSTITLNITPAEWSGGLWGGLENAYLDVWQNTTTRRTAVPTAGAVNVQVKAVNLASKQVQLQLANASDAAFSAIASGDILAFSQVGSTLGASEMLGLSSICGNTGTMFGIAGATYGLWQGNTFANTGAPSIGKILANVATLVERGLDEDVYVLVSPAQFARMNGDQTALRVYDSSYKPGKATNGFAELEYVSENGRVIVKSHRFMKDGYQLYFPLSKLLRVGSTELTFMDMGPGGSIFLQTPGFNTVQMRGYIGQALLCLAPARCGIATGVQLP
jgi:hypothetical protein